MDSRRFWAHFRRFKGIPHVFKYILDATRRYWSPFDSRQNKFLSFEYVDAENDN